MKKLLLLIIVSLLVASVTNATTVWNPAANDPPIVPPAVGNWNEDANWTNGIPGYGPDGDPNDMLDPKAVFNVTDAAECIVTDAQYCDDLVQGEGGPGGVIRVMDGGSLTTTGGWMGVGFNNTAKLIVERGGVYDHAGHFWWGMHTGADSIVEINGGIINGGQSFGLGEWFGADPLDHGQCKVYINDGELNVHHWTGEIDSEHPVFWNDSLIDIGFGKMTIDTVPVDEVQAYIDAGGYFFGFGDDTNVQVVDDDGFATITAIADPLARYPTMDETVAPGSVTLSWNNIESVPPGNPVWVDVRFGTDASQDPNGIYADFAKIVDAGQDTVSAVVSTLTETTEGFYWQVNTYAYGDPAHGIYNTGDDPNLSDWARSVDEGILMVFHAPNGPSCAGLGDLNCSGTVALDDLSYMAGVWLTGDLTADIALPADNMVDTQDLLVVAQQWLDVSQEIAYWMFDETGGDVASDSSVNDYNGILVDMDDTDWVSGNSGNALDFDGIDDYVAVDDIFAEIAGRDLTISAWVKAPAVNPATQFIISINTAGGDNRLLCGTQPGSDTFSLGDTAWHDTTATVIDNTWHHIAYVIDDSANVITVYVDGSDVLSFTSAVSIAGDDLLSFGQEYDPGLITGDFYTGQLDDVRIYDRALSEAEIAILAQ
ncbi:MAG: LamG domain-containing protein [Planctomycetes bacterium]|nr:LamG domain-containing protein [Planctomycetota bacterium]